MEQNPNAAAAEVPKNPAAEVPAMVGFLILISVFPSGFNNN